MDSAPRNWEKPPDKSGKFPETSRLYLNTFRKVFTLKTLMQNGRNASTMLYL